MGEITCFFEIKDKNQSFIIQIDNSVSFAKLLQEVNKQLASLQFAGQVKLSYQDDEGDRIYFASDAELKEALSFASSSPEDLFVICLEVSQSLPQSIPPKNPESIPSSSSEYDDCGSSSSSSSSSVPSSSSPPSLQSILESALDALPKDQQNKPDFSELGSMGSKLLAEFSPMLMEGLKNSDIDVGKIVSEVSPYVSKFCESTGQKDAQNLVQLAQLAAPFLSMAAKSKKKEPKNGIEQIGDLLSMASKFIPQNDNDGNNAGSDIAKMVSQFSPLIMQGISSMSNNNSGNNSSSSGNNGSNPNNLNKQNHMAMCDRCDKMIVGIRYKCLQCEDFDFCDECEAKNFQYKYHDQSHIFAKMYVPQPDPIPAPVPVVPQPNPEKPKEVEQLQGRIDHLESALSELKNLIISNAAQPQQPPQQQQQSPPPAVNINNNPQPPKEQPNVCDESSSEIPNYDLSAEEEQCLKTLKEMGFEVSPALVAECHGNLESIMSKLLS